MASTSSTSSMSSSSADYSVAIHSSDSTIKISEAPFKAIFEETLTLYSQCFLQLTRAKENLAQSIDKWKTHCKILGLQGQVEANAKEIALGAYHTTLKAQECANSLFEKLNNTHHDCTTEKFSDPTYHKIVRYGHSALALSLKEQESACTEINAHILLLSQKVKVALKTPLDKGRAAAETRLETLLFLIDPQDDNNSVLVHKSDIELNEHHNSSPLAVGKTETSTSSTGISTSTATAGTTSSTSTPAPASTAAVANSATAASTSSATDTSAASSVSTSDSAKLGTLQHIYSEWLEKTKPKDPVFIDKAPKPNQSPTNSTPINSKLDAACAVLGLTYCDPETGIVYGTKKPSTSSSSSSVSSSSSSSTTTSSSSSSTKTFFRQIVSFFNEPI